jgi:hypothetical protein
LICFCFIDCSVPSVETGKENASENDINGCEDEEEKGKFDVSGVIGFFSFEFLNVD